MLIFYPAMFAAALLVSVALTPAPVFAMGDAEPAAGEETAEGEEAAEGEDATAEVDAGEEAEEGSDTAGTTDCPEGFTFNPDSESCEQEQGGILRQLPAIDWSGADPAFVEAAVLVHSGAYERAIEAFTALGRPDDPYVLNYLGFANRKLGNVDTALAWYEKALTIRPDYVRARSYMGEGLVALGRIDEAREQLALIAGECGTGCDEYRVLDAAISEYLATAKG